MNKKQLTAALLLSSGLTMIGSAYAATTTPVPLNVSATITASCTVAVTGVSFGNVPEGTLASATGNVDVACSSGTAYTIALDDGQNPTTTRNMTDGTQQLPYELTDGVVLWGDSGTIGSTNAWAPVTGTGTGVSTPTAHTVTANLLPNTVTPATFSDTVQVTVFY